MPLPNNKQTAQTKYCTHLFQENVLRTLLGMGMGMNVTARPTRREREGERGGRRTRVLMLSAAHVYVCEQAEACTGT